MSDIVRNNLRNDIYNNLHKCECRKLKRALVDNNKELSELKIELFNLKIEHDRLLAEHSDIMAQYRK